MLFNATLDRLTEAELEELVAVHQPRRTPVSLLKWLF